jgi:hypothetical protein
MYNDKLAVWGCLKEKRITIGKIELYYYLCSILHFFSTKIFKNSCCKAHVPISVWSVQVGSAYNSDIAHKKHNYIYLGPFQFLGFLHITASNYDTISALLIPSPKSLREVHGHEISHTPSQSI